ncbi:MAG: hypothetical protein GC206_11580 [Alphaproteobacteria bacterium]|nr:hypothetical protein [Alphaproteobacteria bacterium]
MERQDAVERIAIHAAFGLHIVAKWMSERSDVQPELKERLATHLMAIDSGLQALGRSGVHAEFETTENTLHPR